MKALIKRTSIIAQPAVTKWSFEGLNIDISASRVTIDDKEVSLTKKEFEILSLLTQASPKVLTRADILSSVWGENEYVLDRTVDVHITRIRNKLGEYGSMIVNRSGFGYYLNFNDKNENE